MRKLYYLVVIVLAFVIYRYFVPATLPEVPTQPTPTPTKIAQEQAPIAGIYATQLGIPIENIKYLRVTSGGECSGEGLEKGKAIACYQGTYDETYDGTITMTAKSLSRPDSRVIFAHEYMHYVWDTLTPAQRDELSVVTRQLYAQYPKVRERVIDYKANQATIDNELHSYVCTEMTDARIPEPLKSHCIKYLPNRTVLPSLY